MPRQLNPEDAKRIAQAVANAKDRDQKENEKRRRSEAILLSKVLLICAAALVALVALGLYFAKL